MASSPAVRARPLRAAALRSRVGAAVVVLVLGAGCTEGEGSGTGGSPAVDRPSTEDVVAAVTEEGLRARLSELVAATGDSAGYRSVGSEGYERAAAYVEGRLEAAGWSVTTPRVDAPAVVDDGSSSLRVDGRTFGVDDLRPLLLSPAGDVTGPVVAVNGAPGPARRAGLGCSAGDYGELPDRAVVLVPPGGCFRRDQLLAAQEAGAGAFVTYSPGAPDGVVLRPTLASAEGLGIPGAWVSGEAAAALAVAAADAGDARVVLTARTEVRPTRSVVGELRGSGDEVVVLGAHLDSVVDGPGANDDGSGVAALLEIVHALGSSERRASVRVAFWAGEEVGLLGSSRYVGELPDAERESIVLYGNADMVASPNGFAGVYDEPGAAAGSVAAGDLLRDAVARAGGTPVPVDLHGGSDHHPFTVAGVPTAGVFSGALERVTAEQAAASGATAGRPADACYHQACDDLDDVDVALARLLTAALADVAVRVADDPGLIIR
jgi:hypothetical protein